MFTWDVALNADELIGLLGTLSWIITMPDDRRERVVTEARRLLRELLGVEGDVTVDVAFRADAWRSRRHDPARSTARPTSDLLLTPDPVSAHGGCGSHPNRSKSKCTAISAVDAAPTS